MKLSTKWKNWIAIIDPKICIDCKEKQGKIYGISEKVVPSPPLHQHCRCTIQRLKSLFAGEATDRKWYEADIDYSSGNRNSKRIVFSNDGLIFVTYDHYKTFVEIR